MTTANLGSRWIPSWTGLVAGMSLLLTACATADQRPAQCPQAQARFLSCENGVRLVTYEATFDLKAYCEPVQSLESRIGGFDRNRPLYTLAAGQRVMQIGVAGWLVLAKEPGLVDAPQATVAWWTNRACTLPSALR